MSLPAIRTPERKGRSGLVCRPLRDDYEFLGVPEGRLRSSYNTAGEIVRRADAHGFQNILLPSGWIVGQDA